MTDTERDVSSNKDWPAGITRLLDEARTDVEQLLSHGRIDRAAELTRAPGMSFNDTYSPMYFTGTFESQIVLVHLNPKLSPELANYSYADFNDFYAKHRDFGFCHWGLDPSYYSAFDLKQVRFLRPFNVIDFQPEPKVGYSRENAALACDKKLQLELFPYTSQTFETSKFSMAVLEPHFARVLAAISAYPRRYVLFCGAVFDDLIEKSGLLTFRKDHRFRLPTKSGQGKVVYRFSNVMFSLNGVDVQAGIARSFAIQGIPMGSYGSMCSELYGVDRTS